MLKGFYRGALAVILFLLIVQLVDLLVEDQLVSTFMVFALVKIAYYDLRGKNDDDPCL